MEFIIGALICAIVLAVSWLVKSWIKKRITQNSLNEGTLDPDVEDEISEIAKKPTSEFVKVFIDAVYAYGNSEAGQNALNEALHQQISVCENPMNSAKEYVELLNTESRKNLRDYRARISSLIISPPKDGTLLEHDFLMKPVLVGLETEIISGLSNPQKFVMHTSRDQTIQDSIAKLKGSGIKEYSVLGSDFEVDLNRASKDLNILVRANTTYNKCVMTYSDLVDFIRDESLLLTSFNTITDEEITKL